MKFGVLFSFCGMMLVACALMLGGWGFFLLWPGASFLIAGGSYFWFGSSIYRKSKGGLLPLPNLILMFPFLASLWTLWGLLRLTQSERAFDQVTDKIFIGRRLLSHEFPDHFEHVIDLTCEFNESMAARSVDYYSFPILDGHVPPSDSLIGWIDIAANLEGNVFIHCAEGHGRAGMLTTALLIKLGLQDSIESSLRFVQSKRPLVKLRPSQRSLLQQIESQLKSKNWFGRTRIVDIVLRKIKALRSRRAF